MEKFKTNEWIGVPQRCEGIAAELRVLSTIATQSEAESLHSVAELLDELAERGRATRH